MNPNQIFVHMGGTVSKNKYPNTKLNKKPGFIIATFIKDDFQYKYDASALKRISTDEIIRKRVSLISQLLQVTYKAYCFSNI